MERGEIPVDNSEFSTFSTDFSTGVFHRGCGLWIFTFGSHKKCRQHSPNFPLFCRSWFLPQPGICAKKQDLTALRGCPRGRCVTYPVGHRPRPLRSTPCPVHYAKSCLAGMPPAGSALRTRSGNAPVRSARVRAGYVMYAKLSIIRAPKPSPSGEGGSPKGLTDEGQSHYSPKNVWKRYAYCTPHPPRIRWAPSPEGKVLLR